MVLIPRRVIFGFGFVCVLTVMGVVGFMTLEHESFLDAVLTTVSAISTVGYSPPRPLSSAGKILAVGLIIGGLFGIALVISVITEYLMEGQLHGAWERRRLDRAIDALSNHYIIAGFGRVGREVARTFSLNRVPFVVLDINPSSLVAAKASGYLYVEEDASHDDILQRVGITRARGLIACSDSDTNNVYVTLTARALNPAILIVARAAYADAEPKLLKAGADRVVSPYVMAGRHMAELAAQPAVVDSVNLLFDGHPIDVRIEELAVDDMPELAGRSIQELHESVFDGAFVLAMDRESERIQHIRPSLVVQLGDRLLVAGSREQLQKLGTIK